MPLGFDLDSLEVLEPKFLCELLALVEPDPRARFINVMVVFKLHEELEELFLVLFFDADSSVDYFELDGVFFIDEDSVDFHFDETLEGKFHRVSDQVVEDLGQSSWVCVEAIRDFVVNGVLELDPADLGPFGETDADSRQDLPDIGRFDTDRMLFLILEVFFGIRQHVFDQAHQEITAVDCWLDVLILHDFGVFFLALDGGVQQERN